MASRQRRTSYLLDAVRLRTVRVRYHRAKPSRKTLFKDDLVYDLDCGDGRIVVAAALTYGCRAVGYEIDDRKVRQSRQNVNKHGLEKLVRTQQQDIFTLDLREASVITLYLLPEMNDQLVPQLKRMKAGCRIVAHNFAIDGYQHDRLVTLKSKEDDTPHDIFLYTLPLRAKQAIQ